MRTSRVNGLLFLLSGRCEQDPLFCLTILMLDQALDQVLDQVLGGLVRFNTRTGTAAAIPGSPFSALPPPLKTLLCL